ncbi:efflux transporter outer membrane subunit [Chryseobacterium sp. MFBS3-17]|uniref:efflux transporter outer membrane subunit n=1 Tax=Chryseobacterium sp. MFBS3-17 TaxID=2886689 RepID=UPI001D0DD971|nr:efflux transporter outer membrane subunit [Chryseobacterium sp. MFBS3-17]MCC2590057.1 efflux transporter outer membrane subunit [Chryseobacterium sp. MFBS3-17]
MKNSSLIKNIAISATALVLLQSCVARQPFDEKQIAINENLYRTDYIAADSSSIATVSWRNIFTDPILQGHIETGLNNNLDIRIAVQNIVAAEAYLKQKKAAYLPTLSVGPNYTFQTPSLNTVLSNERVYNHLFDLGADLSWDIDIWGKMKAEEKAQLAQYLATNAAHKSVKSDLVAAIATTYYQIMTLDEQKKIIGETITLRKSNLETTRALKSAGTLTEVAVQQSEALVFNAEALLVDVEVQIELLENTMSFLLGQPSQIIARSTAEQQILPGDFALGYSASLLANRADVTEAELRLRSAFELTNAARAQFYPSLRITGSGGLQATDIDQLFSVNSLFATVIGSLVQPILNKRQIRTNYEVTLANQQIAYLNFRKTMLNAGREVADALKVYNAQDRFISLKQQELQAYQKSVSDSQELVNYGLANYLEVINASVSALNAELNISNAKFAKMKAGVELYRALGGGWR